MSRSPYFFVEKYNNETKKYELQHPFVWNYNHTDLIAADLFPYNGCHELFSIVNDENFGDVPKMNGIHAGLPNDVCEEIKKSYNDCSYEEMWGEDKTFHFEPSAKWFTYADMYIYYLKYPEIIDYEAMDENDYEDDNQEIKTIMQTNPIITLKNRVDAFMEVIDDWDWENDYSLIRIVFWII